MFFTPSSFEFGIKSFLHIGLEFVYLVDDVLFVKAANIGGPAGDLEARLDDVGCDLGEGDWDAGDLTKHSTLVHSAKENGLTLGLVDEPVSTLAGGSGADGDVLTHYLCLPNACYS